MCDPLFDWEESTGRDNERDIIVRIGRQARSGILLYLKSTKNARFYSVETTFLSQYKAAPSSSSVKALEVRTNGDHNSLEQEGEQEEEANELGSIAKQCLHKCQIKHFHVIRRQLKIKQLVKLRGNRLCSVQ